MVPQSKFNEDTMTTSAEIPGTIGYVAPNHGSGTGHWSLNSTIGTMSTVIPGTWEWLLPCHHCQGGVSVNPKVPMLNLSQICLIDHP